MPQIIGDDRKDLDPAVADQFTSLIISAGLKNFQLNGATARTELAAVANGLTLAVQRADTATLHQRVKVGPLEAASAANLQASQQPSTMSRLGR